MADANGRWFSFAINQTTLIILEKKGLADHLASLPCINNATPVQEIIRQLEDAGEAGLLYKVLIDAIFQNIILFIIQYSFQVYSMASLLLLTISRCYHARPIIPVLFSRGHRPC